MNLIEKYAAIKQMIALLSGSMREDVLDSVPDAAKNIMYGLQIIEEKMIDKAVALKPELKDIQNAIYEYQQLINLIPSTSYETISKANAELAVLQSEMQNLITFDSMMFYNIYFNLNGATQKSVNNKPVFEPSLGVNTKSFDLWFQGSKVVNDKSEPLIVFHGTGASDFSRFTFDLFPGAYFAENKSYSEWFRTQKGGQDGVMFECVLRITNPIDLRLFKTDKVLYEEFVGYIELMYGYKLPENKMLKTASAQGNGLWAWQYIRGGSDWLKLIATNDLFDGIAFFENNPGDVKKGIENVTPAWLVFKPEQIKAAHGNVTFSYDSKDIRFKIGGEV